MGGVNPDSPVARFAFITAPRRPPFLGVLRTIVRIGVRRPGLLRGVTTVKVRRALLRGEGEVNKTRFATMFFTIGLNLYSN